MRFCERERIRTFDRLLRRQMLYPAELRTHCGKKKFPKELLKVGAAGFEPATSWSQTRRDDRTTLRPEYNCVVAEGVGFEPTRPFRVDSLANCSVNHSGNPPVSFLDKELLSLNASANIKQFLIFTKKNS